MKVELHVFETGKCAEVFPFNREYTARVAGRKFAQSAATTVTKVTREARLIRDGRMVYGWRRTTGDNALEILKPT